MFKSPSDRKEYRCITLENMLDVVLCRDLTTTLSSASMVVGVGSYNDNGTHGLAHFLEHMLFLGSEKYPDDGHYTSLVKRHGGYTNAYTSKDHTMYYFDVNNSAYEESLDVFSRFFIDPLLTKDCTEREVNAVHSEYVNNLTKDDRRYHGVRRAIANPDHPFSGFSTGNLDTLNKPDIFDQMRKFYDKYYSSNIMKLCVVSNMSLNDLEKIVSEKFSLIINKNVVVNKFFEDNKIPPYIDLNVLVKIVPIRKTDILNITWIIPNPKLDITVQPTHYLTHLMGDESTGSIYDVLKNKGYIHNLYTSHSDICPNFSMMSVKMELTETGYVSVEYIINTIYEFIDLIKSTNQKHLYNNYVKVKEINWLYQKNKNAIDISNHIALCMFENIVDNELILTLDVIMEPFTDTTKEVLDKYINMLTRENSITSIISPKVEGLTDSIDEWYKAKYNCQKNTYKYRDNEDLCGILQMPPINPFIPKSFDGEKRESMDVPIELKDSIYYKYVSRYGTPYSYAYIKIDMDKTYGDTFQTVLNCVFTDVLHETLNPILYVASNLRYHWTTKYTDGGIYFTFSGFSDRISDISEYVVDCLNDMKSRFTIENFERTVSKLNLHWKNNKYGLLYNNISRYASEEIDPMFPTIDKMIEQLNKLKFDDLFGYFEGKSMKVTALIEGDISEENALKIVEPFFDFVSKRSIGDYTNNFLKEYINKEDINGKAIYKPSENDKELSSCIHISYLYGYSSSLKTHDYYKINVHSILLANLIKDAFYNQLRTKEQLGYAVFSQRTSYGMSQYTLRAQSFTIQSLSMKAVNLVNRVEDFITKFIDDITSLTDEKLEKYKGSLIESYNKTPVNLSEEAGNDLLAIILNDYVFNWREIYINEIKKIDKKSIEEFYRTYFLSGSSVTKFVLGIDPVKME